MTVGTDAAKEQVDATELLDLLLVSLALSSQVGGVAIEDVDILLRAVDVVEQVAEHEAMVALRMVDGQADILIHIEGNDVLERHLALLIGLNQGTIHADR